MSLAEKELHLWNVVGWTSIGRKQGEGEGCHSYLKIEIWLC